MPGKINSLTEDEQNKLLENKFGVTSIDFEEEVQHFCPLGEQIGITKYKVVVVPGKYLAELIQLHWNIQHMMGKTFTLESGAKMVLDFVKEAYSDAKYISVVASCDKNRHMAANVKVEYYG